ncbi:MAG: glycosyltransferase family 2 protein [Anaerolineales bacterium]|nr:glycosyltransferase family 2 protein [Anaerolineales bacterium]
MIVPCKGDGDPYFGENLLGIICQEYTGPAQFIFCVESQTDSALPVLYVLKQQYAQVEVCVAGLATTSGQKNLNIIKGMEQAGPVDIFLFADADIQPHRTWLQEMIAPFTEPDVGAVTGCFRRVPAMAEFRLGNYLAGLFGAGIVTGMTSDVISGLWGGSLAIRRAVIEQLGLQERLATEIVDDIAIMHALHQARMERRFVPSCTLKSYCDMSTPASIEWLVRQFQFSQIYFKKLYFFYYVFGLPYAFSILAAPLAFTYGLVNGSELIVSATISFWLSVILVGLLLYRGIPVNPASVSPHDIPYQLIPWLAVTPLAFVAGALALLKTLLRVKHGILTMYWRNIEYKVDVKTGKVLEIIR